MNGTHLLNLVRVAKAPATRNICFPNGVTGIAASTFGRFGAEAGATVAIWLRGVNLRKVALKFGRVRVGDRSAAVVEPSLDDIVRNIALHLAADIHDVQA